MKARLTQLLFAIPAALVITCHCAVAEPGDTIVSLPQTEAMSIKKHTAEDDDKELTSIIQQNFRLMRADNLVAAQHYDEAIPDFAAGAPECHFLSQRQMQLKWGYACEKTGNIDEAIEHYKEAKEPMEIARLLIAQGKFAEAETVANAGAKEARDYGEKNKESYTQLREWLKFRAAARVGKQDIVGAIKDLEEAAVAYKRREPAMASRCIEEAKALAKQYKLPPVAALDSEQVKQEGAGNVYALINYLLTCGRPCDIKTINALTGSHFPEKREWIVQENSTPLVPFDQVEHRTTDGRSAEDDTLTVGLDIEKCCLTRDAVLKELKKTRTDRLTSELDVDKIYGTGAWQETYTTASGKVVLEYESYETHFLQKIQFTSVSPSQQAALAASKDSLSELVKSISLEAGSGHYAEALTLAKSAVARGGRFYLNEQSKVEELLGQNDAAIRSLLEFLGGREPGPETVQYYNRLANLYIKSKNFSAAMDAIEKAMVGSQNTAGALFLRAQANAGLGKNDAAKIDAEAAIKQYFDKGQIVRRDEVIGWVKNHPMGN